MLKNSYFFFENYESNHSFDLIFVFTFNPQQGEVRVRIF